MEPAGENRDQRSPRSLGPIPNPGRPLMKTLRRLLLVAVSLTASGGCGYTLRTPYNRELKTIYVPMFKSQRFRRDLNLQLTQLVQQEIQTRTPYRIVNTPEQADCRLDGVITYDDKNIIVENPNNLPRHLQASMYVTVSFTDNRTGVTTTKVSPPAFVAEAAPFYPEIGDTAELGFQKVMQKLARDIASMMEDPWGDEYREDPDVPPIDPDDRPDPRPGMRRPQ